MYITKKIYYTISLVPSCGVSVVVAADAGGVSVVGSVAVTSDMTSCVGVGGFTPNSRFIRSHTLSCVSLMGTEASPSESVDCTSTGGVRSTVGIGIVGVGNTSVTATVGVSSLAGATSSVTILAGGTRFVLGFFLGPGSGAAYVGVINGGVTEGTGGVTEGAGGVTEGAGGVTDAIPVGFTEGTGGVTDGGVTDGATGVTVALGTTGNPGCGGSIG